MMILNWFRRLLIAVIAACSVAASASDFPSRPIKLIVPYAPGSSIADLFARQVGAIMSRDLGQAVVIENKPGANGSIGASALVQALPDGHTLLLATNSVVVLNPLLSQKLVYDPAKFKMLAVGLEAPFVLTVNPRVPAKTVSEFVAYARKPGSKLNYSSAGIGNAVHVATEMFKSMAQIEMVHIPYNGKAGEMLAAVLSGDVEFLLTAVGQAAPHIKSGKLRALAVTTDKRMRELPDVPTVAEIGYPNLRPSTWYGIAIHASTPETIVARLREAMDKALVDPAFIEHYAKQEGIVAQVPRTAAELEAYVTEDTRRWAEVIRARQITLN